MPLDAAQCALTPGADTTFLVVLQVSSDEINILIYYNLIFTRSPSSILEAGDRQLNRKWFDFLSMCLSAKVD